MQLFTVQPLDFLVKPIANEKLVHTIQKGLEMISYSEELFMCKVGRDHIAMNCKEILYFMSDKRKISVWELVGKEMLLLCGFPVLAVIVLYCVTAMESGIYQYIASIAVLAISIDSFVECKKCKESTTAY